LANVDKSFAPITPDNSVRRLEDVEIKRIFNRDDDYGETLTLKFIDEKIDELNRKIDKLRDEIIEYRRLRGLVHSEALKVVLKS
jgi:hypothetical protein